MSVLTAEMQEKLRHVDGQILPEEGLILAELAAQVSSERLILEIGAYKGKSSCYLAAGAKAGGGALVYSVDLWVRAPWVEYADPIIPVAWRDNIGHLGLVGQAIPICADAREAAKLVDHGIALIFIDGDHSFEGCCRDIETWLPRVDVDGVMVFHDAASEDWGVGQAIRARLPANGKYTHQVEHGLCIVRRDGRGRA